MPTTWNGPNAQSIQAAISDKMTLVELPSKSGRRLKFTPERIQQIKNLVERGATREEIAETIDVTVGSLQVTCSRLGISLRRRPPPGPVVGMLPRRPTPPASGGSPPLVTREVSADSPSLTLVLRYRGR